MAGHDVGDEGVGRRRLLKTIGAGAGSLIGFAGGVSANSHSVAAASSELPITEDEILNEPVFEASNTFEQNIGVNLSTNLAYLGSERVPRTVDGGGISKRWAHAFQLSAVGQCKIPGQSCYNITSQTFKVKPSYGGSWNTIEFHEDPEGGIAAWPKTPSGSWNRVFIEVLEKAVLELNGAADCVKTAYDIYHAYHRQPFDTNTKNEIKFAANHNPNSKQAASHSATFMIDTVPGKPGYATISSGMGVVESEYWVQMEDNILGHVGKKRDQYSSSHFTETRDEGDILDSLSDDELAEYGIVRIDPSSAGSFKSQSMESSVTDEPIYYTESYPFDIQHRCNVRKIK